MKKFISILLCILLLLSLSACQVVPDPVDEFVFLRVAKELSLTTGDLTQEMSQPAVSYAVFAHDGNSCNFDFLRCTNIQSAIQMYESYLSIIKNSNSAGLGSNASKSIGSRYNRYFCESGGLRWRLVRIDNTVLCAVYEEDDIPLVQEMFGRLNYE